MTLFKSFRGRALMVGVIIVVVSSIVWTLEVAFWPQHATSLALEQFSDNAVASELHRQTEYHGALPATGAVVVASVWGFLFLPGYQKRLAKTEELLIDWWE